MSRRYNVAIVGATGMVGREFIKVLEQRKFPVEDIRLLASERSKGKKMRFCGRDFVVRELTKDSFNQIDIALFSAGAAISKEFSPLAVKAGAIVVDNSNAWRMDPEVPLVVPEVNSDAIKSHKGIIANPNCSTIQLVVVLKPLHDVAKIKRIVISTYQSASGWGKEAVNQLLEETKEILKGKLKPDNIKRVLPAQIAFNVIPQIDVFLENRYTKEEMKLVNETRKIMGSKDMNITATCVRVPVVVSHSEAVNIEFERELSVEEATRILKKAPGVYVVDDISKERYPLPIDAAGKDETFVGRIRKDYSVPTGINLWIVSDNLRKGAALNAVQIAELLTTTTI